MPTESDQDLADTLFYLLENECDELDFQPLSNVDNTDTGGNQDQTLLGYPSTSSLTTASTDSARSSNAHGFFASITDVDEQPARKRQKAKNPTPPGLTQAEKNEHRRIRNKESAAESRRAKNAYIEALEVQVEALKAQVQQLETQNQALIADNTELTEQNRLSNLFSM
jgi:hypothetical protein